MRAVEAVTGAGNSAEAVTFDYSDARVRGEGGTRGYVLECCSVSVCLWTRGLTYLRRVPFG